MIVKISKKGEMAEMPTKQFYNAQVVHTDAYTIKPDAPQTKRDCEKFRQITDLSERLKAMS